MLLSPGSRAADVSRTRPTSEVSVGWRTSGPAWLITDVDAVCWQQRVIMGLVLKGQSAHVSLTELVARHPAAAQSQAGLGMQGAVASVGLSWRG